TPAKTPPLTNPDCEVWAVAGADATNVISTVAHTSRTMYLRLFRRLTLEFPGEPLDWSRVRSEKRSSSWRSRRRCAWMAASCAIKRTIGDIKAVRGVSINARSQDDSSQPLPLTQRG